MRNGIGTPAVLLVALLLIASCSEAAPAPPQSSTATETPQRGGQLVLGGPADISTLQPVLGFDNISASVYTLIYATLLETDPATGELRAGLAERFAVTNDGKRVTYTLRTGLLWSDGTPLTGADYKYMVSATARSKKSPNKAVFKDIVGWDDYVAGRTDDLNGVQLLDGGRTIQIDMRRGRCSALRDLGSYPPLSEAQFGAYWDARTRDTTTSIDGAAFNRAPPVASGPFAFAEYKPLDFVRLVRNERYYKGAPLLDGVIFKVFSDQTAQRFAFITGELTNASNIPPADVDDLRKRMGATATDFTIKGTAFTYLGLNAHSPNAPWLADKRVRQALWYGLDIETMLKPIYLGLAHRVFAYTPQESWAYDGTGLERYDFDPKRARSLLESAGATMGADGLYRWRDGRAMTMRIEVGNNMGARVTFVQAMQAQYRDIGIKADIAVEPFPALLARNNAHESGVDGYVVTSGGDPEVTDAYEFFHSSQQDTNAQNFWFTDPELDRALDAGLFGPDCSAVARRAAFHRMDRIVNEAAPVLFMYAGDTISFRSSKLVAPPPLPFGTRYDIEKWWLRVP
ncbi:MAG: ABC transporter substrate-binding protein [Chloroflexi bacterium]|nr:MAG: ABC transporter substrate-binding protein [Chloroflexota bacterium]